MAIFVSDSFAGTAGTTLESHTGTTGATWTKHPSYSGSPSAQLDGAGGVYSSGGTSGTIYYASGVPATAEYDVGFTLNALSLAASDNGVCARVQTGANTYYWAEYNTANARWELYLCNAGSFTLLGSFTQTLVAGNTYTCVFQCRTAAKVLTVNGSAVITSADNTITAAGRAGLGVNNTQAAATGIHLQSYSATDYVAAANATGYSLACSPSSVTVGSPTTVTATLTGGTALSSTLTITLADSLASTVGGTISIASGSTTGSATITPSAAGTHVITATHTGGGFSGGDGSTSFTATAPATTIAVNDANLFLSPGNWYVNGSTYAQTNNPGAYLKIGFAGTSLGLNVDVSTLTGASVAPGSYPTIDVSVDDGTPTRTQLTSASTTITTTGLASGNHTLRVDYVSGDFNVDRWTTPVMVLRITGFAVDPGGSSVAPTLRPKRLIVLGDSITEGAYITSATSPGGQDATLAFGHALGAALNAEVGIIGFAGQGYESTGLTNVPALPSSYNLYSAGHARSWGSPDYILLIEGTNGTTTTADASTMLGNLRTACPSAAIFLGVPFGGFARSAIAAAPLPDVNCHLVDLGTDAQVGLTGTNNAAATREAAAGPHPRPYIHGQLGARLAQAVQAALGVTSAHPVRFRLGAP